MGSGSATANVSVKVNGSCSEPDTRKGSVSACAVPLVLVVFGFVWVVGCFVRRGLTLLS